MLKNRVREIRERLGLSRESLAQRTGVTRQAVGLIETGRMIPSTLVSLRLASVLGTRVEHLFFEAHDAEAEFHVVPPAVPQFPARVYVASVGERDIVRAAEEQVSGQAHPPAHGILRALPARPASPLQAVDEKNAGIEWLRQRSTLPDTVYVTGCEVALPLLVNYVSQAPTRQGVWFNRSNQQALSDFEDGLVHVAAVHLAREAKWHSLPNRVAARVFHFAEAELGFALPKGNPRGFRGVEDLTGGTLRIVNRPAGSGARRLLDRVLTEAAVDAATVPGYHAEVWGHADVADAIASGFADLGITHAGAAASRGLMFIPLQQERCSLLIRTDAMERDAVKALLDTLQSGRFHGELGALGPYDTSATGTEYRNEAGAAHKD
ncbi:MAG: helix-turn-helix domain-containing protein [Firmicutes bacterium]|nr:helix-turn-helix domain-containing protein [Bacillota bacterium]